SRRPASDRSSSSLTWRRGPRGLLSFPTRRSSDLGRGVRRHDDHLIGGARVGAGERGIVATDLRACPLRMIEKVEVVDRHDAGRVDRKSTRLNSSHVKISYAVFCLKKKISVLRSTA